MRVLLSDEGEGWRSGAPSVLPGHVVGDVSANSGAPYTMVQFDSPLGLRELRGLLFFRWRVTVYVGAWVRPRASDQVVGIRGPISVQMWMVDQESGWGVPPEHETDLRALCTRMT